MAKRKLTLYIDDTSLRLVVAQGKEIKEWVESPLEPGLVENNAIIKEAEVASAIKSLCGPGMAGARIGLAISGLHCMTRPISFPKLPKEMLAEAVTREAQRTLPVPIEDLYFSWQIIPSDAAQMQIFFVGIPRKTADAIFRTLRQAGLKAGFMELKPLLLARAVKDTEAIIIDTQATEFDIVVIADGIPKIRTVQFATGALSREEKLTAVKNELNRGIAFYNTNNPQKPLSDKAPILVSGDLSADPELHQSLSQDAGRPVLPLQAPLETPAGLDPGRYMANICLILPAIPAKQRASAAIANLNTIPTAYQTKAISLVNILPLPGVAAAAIILVLLVLFSRSASADIKSLKSQINETNRLLQQKQAERQGLITSITALQKSINTANTSRSRLASVLTLLSPQSQGAGDDLASAISSAPQYLTLTSLRHIGNVLTLMGSALSEKQVSSYITKLDNTGRFGSIALTDMTKDEAGNSVEFTIVATLQAKSIGTSSIEVVLGSLPTSVTLTTITSGENSLSVAGTASNADRVFAYLRALEARGEFKLVTITDMKTVQDGSIDFSLELKTGA